MLPHRMNLKGPWRYTWLSDSSESKPSGRITMPVDWRSAFGEVSGSIRFERNFNLPSNLEAHERVFVVLDGVGGAARVNVNAAGLGTIAPPGGEAAFDVTELLQPSNRLVVEVDFAPSESSGPGGLWAPVGIEIRDTEAQP